MNLDEASNDVRDAVDKAHVAPSRRYRPSYHHAFQHVHDAHLDLCRNRKKNHIPVLTRFDDKLITRLNRVDGVARYRGWSPGACGLRGLRPPNKLDAYNLTLEQIGSKILAENKDVSSGNVKMGQMDYTFACGRRIRRK